MFAYAPDGTKIIGTLERQTGVARAEQGGFTRLPDGSVECAYTGYTDWYEDSNVTIDKNGDAIFIDADHQEWLGSQLILREAEIEDGEKLDPAQFPAWKHPENPTLATYTIGRPAGGVRSLDSFTPYEKQRLRPIAETLAMLDGNSFFGITTDNSGDDTHYEQYLPEAAALVATTSGCESASFMREPRKIPHTLVHADTHETKTYRVSEIEWDTDGEPKPDSLPTELMVAVDAHLDPATDVDFADILSNQYGFCIKSYNFEAA